MSESNLAPEEIELDSKNLSNVSFNSKIGLLSDLHAKEEDKDEIILQVENAVQKFKNRGVDTVVVLGDIIHEVGRNDLERMRSVVSSVKSDQFKTVFVPGNHDLVEIDIDEFLEITEQEDDHGVFEINRSIDGVYLNTSAPDMNDSRGYVPEDQVDFLEKHLERSNKQNVIFTHHPVHYHNIPEDSWFSKHPECVFAHNKYIVEEVISKSDNVFAVVNGHAHIGNIREDNDTVQITVSAMNYYKPEHQGITGYSSVLEVSESFLRYDEYSKIGMMDNTNYQTNIDYKSSSKVALGGTFDPIHDGHKSLFRSALGIGDLVVGLTSDNLAPKTRHEERFILPYIERKAALENVLSDISSDYESQYDIRELDKPEGLVTEDQSITHLIVSPETLGRAMDINQERVTNGYDPLTIEVIERETAEDGEVLSSTRICKGEIDVHGNLTPSANGREPINNN